MKKINRTMFFSILVILAYILSACSGAPAIQSSNGQSSQSGQVQEVVFTGTVDSMGGGEWTISGQAVTVDSTTSVDSSVIVGANVKVEARVDQGGKVTAVSIEIAGADNANANSNDANQNDSNANDNAVSNSNDNQGDNSNSNSDNVNTNDNSNTNNNDNSSAVDEQEVSGVVEAITTDSITIDGVVYMLADFTEFKGIVALGDSVKIHVIVNADGTFTIREIEKTGGSGLGDSNSNSNSNGSDDNSNINSNSNGNDDNGNDDNGNDNNSNSNSNGNGNG